jgi:AmiR/NasT family two-component response regulator
VILLGLEIAELGRGHRDDLNAEHAEHAERLETRKVVDRAKGILQRDPSLTEDRR